MSKTMETTEIGMAIVTAPSREAVAPKAPGVAVGAASVATQRYGFDDYQKDAARTGGTDLLPENRDKGINCAALGLCGESGEFADIVKKVQHHGVPLTPELTAKLRKELGDVLWYVAHGCNVMNWRMEDIAAENRDKLRARYPDGFSTAASIERRDVIAEGGAK